MDNWMDGLTDEQRAKVDDLQRTMRSEFSTSMQTEEARRATAITDIEELKSDALAALRWCLNHAESAHIRSKVAMWTYEKLLDQGKATKDPLADLMGEIEKARANAG